MTLIGVALAPWRWAADRVLDWLIDKPLPDPDAPQPCAVCQRPLSGSLTWDVERGKLKLMHTACALRERATT